MLQEGKFVSKKLLKICYILKIWYVSEGIKIIWEYLVCRHSHILTLLEYESVILEKSVGIGNWI